jgi:hypothetical protein
MNDSVGTTRSGRSSPLEPFGGVDADYQWRSWVNHATARRSAVDLAEGIGLLLPDPETNEPSGDQRPWPGTPCVSSRDDRREVIVWADDQAIEIQDHPDGFATYGRLDGPVGYPDTMTRVQGIVKFGPNSGEIRTHRPPGADTG